MASHTVAFNLNDAFFRLLLAKQSEEGKDFTVDGKPVSPDLYAKELLTKILDPEGKFSKTE